jgi:uncharacterized protein YeaO (DUF488 family)
MSKPTSIRCARVYDQMPPGRAYRALVDRVWPRGVRKQELALDAWCRELAPSTALRQWFGHDPARWDDFRKRYFTELEASRDEIRRLLDACGSGPLLLLYGARDVEHNNAQALREFIESSVF